MAPTSSVRCAIYTRQSRARKSSHSSCEAQFDQCHAFLHKNASLGWVWNGTRYDDVGASGENLNRPGLQRLIADIRAGLVDRVIIHRLDRFSRRLREFAVLLAELRELKVPLTIVTSPDLSQAAADTLFLNIVASFAEFEHEMIRERLAESRASLKAQGRRVAGRVPYGFAANPRTKQLEVNWLEARRVRQMFEWAQEGRLPSEIANIANRRRWRTRGENSDGGAWTSRQVLETLRNPVYAGFVQGRGIARQGVQPSIVDSTLFDKVQKTIDARRLSKRKRQAGQSVWPLRGIVHCGRCGRPMTPSLSHKGNIRYRYYRCKSQSGGRPPCKGICAQAPALEDLISRHLAELGRRRFNDADARAFAATIAEMWSRLTDRQKFHAIPLAVERVVFNGHRGDVQIVLRSDAIEGISKMLAKTP